MAIECGWAGGGCFNIWLINTSENISSEKMRKGNQCVKRRTTLKTEGGERQTLRRNGAWLKAEGKRESYSVS